jgi:pilus assembly protein CpaD
MPEATLNSAFPNRSRRRPRTSGLAAISAVALAAALALTAGCANRDSIKVGSVPDDYRTNHPIVVAEAEKTIDIPVGMSDSGMSRVQRIATDGFIANYDRKAAPVVTVLVPYGSANQAAASLVAGDLVTRLRAGGVPDGHILHQSYDASRYGDSAPIRLIYAEMQAKTGQCGRWPEDLLETTENKHWANFGCSYQNNLAAQIANPADLLGPRKPSEIDTERRSISIDDYRVRESIWTPETDY